MGAGGSSQTSSPTRARGEGQAGAAAQLRVGTGREFCSGRDSAEFYLGFSSEAAAEAAAAAIRGAGVPDPAVLALPGGEGGTREAGRAAGEGGPGGVVLL